MIAINSFFEPIHKVPVGSVVETKDGTRVHIIDAPSNNAVPVRRLHEYGHLEPRTSLLSTDEVRYISSIIDYEAIAERA